MRYLPTHPAARDLMHPAVATYIRTLAEATAKSLAADDAIPTWVEIDNAIQSILENNRSEEGRSFTDEELADAAIERLKGDSMWPLPVSNPTGILDPARRYTELARRSARRGIIFGIIQGMRHQAEPSDEGEVRYRIEAPLGITFPAGSQEFGHDGQPTGYVLLTIQQLAQIDWKY